MSTTSAPDAAGLIAAAEAVLEKNWTGASTVPSRRQYPHQWGWDAAYNALGWSWIDQARAAQELESILRGQWADGRVPHIVFHPGVDERAYFPGPGFWGSEDVPGGPGHAATSGLTQPPLHARAVLEVALHARDREAADTFLRRVFGPLAAQHAYLAGRRDAAGAGLAAIVHPWESGLDDSPSWDEPLAAVVLPAAGVAPYERRDRDHVDAAERPSDAAYDRFVHLARAYRDNGYADDALAQRSQFLVEDPLFNAIWLWSTRALAEIATLIGADAGPYREAAAGIHAALISRLWDEEAGRFMARDLHAGRRLDKRTVGTLAPLLDPDLPAGHVRALADQITSAHFSSPAGIGVASYDLLAPDADARRYWRGPVWANLNWLLARGLRQHGLDAEADALGATTLHLVTGAGMREYFDPETGAGRGSDEFSWTAAVVVDLLRSAPPSGSARA
jgi:glycogen debranching enzyme